jgi:hypothetical protein
MTKEDKILEIIRTNINVPGHLGAKICGEKEAAKEIHEHYMKFIDWKDEHSDFIYREFDTNKYLMEDIETGNMEMKEYTFLELYQHWLTLPENKVTLKDCTDDDTAREERADLLADYRALVEKLKERLDQWK